MPGDIYRPIQPGEKGTLISGVSSLADVPSGRAALTPERERELGGAPFRKDQPDRGSDRGAPDPRNERGTRTTSTTQQAVPVEGEQQPTATTAPTEEPAPATTTPAAVETTPTETTPATTTQPPAATATTPVTTTPTETTPTTTTP
jgi:hypothetical protein